MLNRMSSTHCCIVCRLDVAVRVPGDCGRAPHIPVRVHHPQLATGLLHRRALCAPEAEGARAVVLYLLQGHGERPRVTLALCFQL